MKDKKLTKEQLEGIHELAILSNTDPEIQKINEELFTEIILEKRFRVFRDDGKSISVSVPPKKDYSLVGINGNAFNIMGYVSSALKETGHADLKDEYLSKAKSGNYDNLLAVSQDYIDIANGF